MTGLFTAALYIFATVGLFAFVREAAPKSGERFRAWLAARRRGPAFQYQIDLDDRRSLADDFKLTIWQRDGGGWRPVTVTGFVRKDGEHVLKMDAGGETRFQINTVRR